ncbi:MAG: hypothetical protein JKY93_00920 [Gammaproteobacteria bacterium]|nr:hypothetical protein [Gammaproteobacteria bacterium]
MEKKEDKNTWIKFALGAAAFVVVALTVNLVAVPILYKGEAIQPGTFGDMFGGVNALFSGFAFIGVVIAIVLQSQELKLQRLDLEKTREVMVDQKQALEEQRAQMELQNQTMRRQQFENTFFELLRLLSSSDAKKFRDAAYNINVELTRNRSDGGTSKYSEDANKIINNIIDGLRMDHYPYIERLNNVISFVNLSDITNKGLYIALIKTEITAGNQMAIYYLLATPNGKDLMLYITDKYDLLGNLDFDYIATDFEGAYERKILSKQII